MKTTFNFVDDAATFRRNAKRLGSNIILQGVHDYQKYCGLIKNSKYFNEDCKKYYNEICNIRNFANTELFDSLQLMSKDVYLKGLERIELRVCGKLVDDIILEKRSRK